ncbi:unnamed protein product [Dicrocoelium dendriticum]|nr:unnamed protein product [Dicrocoelium dendriticum]
MKTMKDVERKFYRVPGHLLTDRLEHFPCLPNKIFLKLLEYVTSESLRQIVLFCPTIKMQDVSVFSFRSFDQCMFVSSPLFIFQINLSEN